MSFSIQKIWQFVLFLLIFLVLLTGQRSPALLLALTKLHCDPLFKFGYVSHLLKYLCDVRTLCRDQKEGRSAISSVDVIKGAHGGVDRRGKCDVDGCNQSRVYPPLTPSIWFLLQHWTHLLHFGHQVELAANTCESVKEYETKLNWTFSRIWSPFFHHWSPL